SSANVEFSTYRDANTGEIRMGIFVVSKKTILPGEELLLSYGKGFWAARGLLDSFYHDHGGGGGYDYEEYDRDYEEQ
ncbi:hypothetical protein HDU76_002058, partial [Blyttiomyces sp. JEL0837]